MNAGPDIERLITSWLIEESPGRAPDRILEAAGRVIDRTHQRRFVAAWREPMHLTIRGFMVAAAIGAVFIGGTLLLLPGAPSSNVGGPPIVSQAPASPTPSPSPSPSASGPLTACGLLTSDEVETYAAAGSLGARPSASGTGVSTTCIYSDGGGDILLHLTYTSAGGRVAFESVQRTAGVQVVTDIGTDAVFDPATATLYVANGDSLVALRAGTSTQTPEVRLSRVRTLGELVADRM
jgi:hypothetical protein